MFRPTDYAQKRHNYMPGGALRRHQTVKKAFTIFTLAVLTCCPGITAIVFNHAKMSNLSKQSSIMDAENIYFVIQGRQYEHIQDEQFLLDCHELFTTMALRAGYIITEFLRSSYPRWPETYDNGLTHMNSTRSYTSRSNKNN